MQLEKHRLPQISATQQLELEIPELVQAHLSATQQLEPEIPQWVQVPLSATQKLELEIPQLLQDHFRQRYGLVTGPRL